MCRKYWVGGRVQGVYYRATVAEHACKLGVRGYARNIPDGRVEVLACGDAAALDALVKGLWTGSSASKVTSVQLEETPCQPHKLPEGFTTA